MTPEQFIFWLNGLLTASAYVDRMNENEYLLLESIKKALKMVEKYSEVEGIIATHNILSEMI